MDVWMCECMYGCMDVCICGYMYACLARNLYKRQVFGFVGAAGRAMRATVPSSGSGAMIRRARVLKQGPQTSYLDTPT